MRIRRDLIIVIIVALLVFLPTAVFATSLLVSWNTTVDQNLAGYKVYYGTQSGTYSGLINAGNTASCQLSGVLSGTTYYVAVSAYDVYQQESSLSAERSITVPAAVQSGGLTLRSPVNGTTMYTNPVFSWAGKGFSSYRVYISLDGKKFTRIYTGSGTSCSMQQSLWSLFIPSGTTLIWYVEGNTPTAKSVDSPSSKFVKG